MPKKWEKEEEEAPPVKAAPKKVDPITAFLAAHGFARIQVQTIEPMQDCNMILTGGSRKIRIALDE